MLIGKLLKTKTKKFEKHFFSGLSFQSHTCKKNYIFFAIKGNTNDGHNYIDQAIKNGARTIIHQGSFEGFKNKILFLSYKNTRKVLAHASYNFFKKKPKNIIAVTGTNGKSSVSDFYFQILKASNIKVASIGTLGIKYSDKVIKVNNTTLDSIHLAKNLSFLKKKKINNVILEASSHGLKQNRLDGLNFSSAIFTNFSHDHLDYHKNSKDYLKSKLYLFNALLKKKKIIITDRSIKEFNQIKKISKKKNFFLKTILDSKSNIKLLSHKYDNFKQNIKIRYKKKNYTLSLNLIGRTQIKNVLMAVLAAENSKINLEKIIKNIGKLKSVNGRFEKIGSLKNNSMVILDYAHTPDALKTCLSDLKSQFENKKINIVFGCGGDRDKYKRSKMGSIANLYCNKVYLTDDNPRFENPKKIRDEIKRKIFSKKVFEIPNRSLAISKAIENLKSNEILVVAGKGHELTQDYGNKKKFFSDKFIIKKLIRQKNKKISSHLKVNIISDYFNKKISKYIKINKASIDSKTIKKNEIFFAIKGKKKDGNLFIKNAFDNGAYLAVVNKYKKNISKKKQLKVNDSLNCMTNLSKKVRESFEGSLVAITGSCGKTSLKQMIGESINKFSNTTFSPKSYNNKYGVPLSLFNLNLEHKSGIFEVGMDKKGEIDSLSKILMPDIGIITNISYAHAKNFENINQIAEAKSELINNIKSNGTIILNKDDKYFNFLQKKAKSRNLNVTSFALKKNADIFLKSIRKIRNKYELHIKIFKKNKFFYMDNKNQNNIYNILASITAIYLMGYYKNLKPYLFYKNTIPEGRGDISKVKFKNKRFYLIDESYNSNPMSMRSAIRNLNLIKAKSKKHFIMGDMLELGKFSRKQHIKISKDINTSSIYRVHVLGRFVKDTYKNISLNKKGNILSKQDQIKDLIVKELNNNDYLMVKGSNSTGLNKFVKKLKGNKLHAL